MDDVAENRFLARWAELLPRADGQVGGIHETDAELVPLGDGRLLALTVDTVAEELAASLYREPETAGYVAAVAALSDLAAVGAAPLGLLLSVTLPAADAERVQSAVAHGVAAACRAGGAAVLGGDTGEGEGLAVTCVGAGLVEQSKATLRTGARPGDLLFASGPLGLGSALAAGRLLEGAGATVDEAAFRPAVRTAEGGAIAGLASACIDTSDGLVAALDQLARLNGTAIRVDGPLERLLHPVAGTVRRRSGLPAFAFLAGCHGEFELVFSVPHGKVRDLGAVAAAMGWSPVPLGRVEEGSGLHLAGRAIDGARVRNLLGEVGGDVVAYARELCVLWDAGGAPSRCAACSSTATR